MSLFAFYFFPMRQKKKTAAQFFNYAEAHGLEPFKKTDLNNDKVSK